MENHIQQVEIKKPNRFLLLPKSSLSASGQDIFAILLLKVNESYDRNWFGKFDLDDLNISTELNLKKSMIMDSLVCEYSLSNSDLMEITNFRKRDLLKPSKIDKRTKIENQIEQINDFQSWDFELDRASKELHNILLETYSFNLELNEWERVINPLLVSSVYNGEKLKFSLHKSVAFELICLNMERKGFSKIPKDLFFSIKNIYAKKILELLCRFKNMVDFKISVDKYFRLFGIEYLSIENSKERGKMVEKALTNAIKYLVSKSNGVISYRDNYHKGFEFVNYGSHGSITKNTIIIFRLDYFYQKEIKKISNKTSFDVALNAYRALETFNNDMDLYYSKNNTLKLTDEECIILFKENMNLIKKENLILTSFMFSIIQPIISASINNS